MERRADKLSKSGIDMMSLYRLPIFKMGVMPLSSVGTLAAMASLMSLTSDSPSVLRDMPWSVAHGQLAGADAAEGAFGRPRKRHPRARSLRLHAPMAFCVALIWSRMMSVNMACGAMRT